MSKMDYRFLLGFALLLLGDRSLAVEFTNAQIAGRRAIVCSVNVRTEHLQLFLRNDAGEPLKSFEHVDRWLKPRGRRLSFAMNAGMYHPDGAPVGLLVADGRQIIPLNTTNGEGNFFLKPNGVFLISETGARVVESSEYPRLRERAILATQSGPLLVHDGRIHPGFRPDSQSRHVRNAVGVPSPDVALFVITEEPVTFHELATFFRDALKCPDALYLDGAICSLHSTRLKRSDRKTDLGPMIGVTEGF
jgi:uncharacterized protein YigE (DUF2233 family)